MKRKMLFTMAILAVFFYFLCSLTGYTQVAPGAERNIFSPVARTGET